MVENSVGQSSSVCTKAVSAGGELEPPTVKLLCDSLSALHTKIDGLTSKVDSLQNDLHGINGLENRMTALEDEMDMLGGSVAHTDTLRDELQLLRNIVIRQDKLISVLGEDLMDQKRRAMRNNLLFYNIHETPRENAISVIHDILQKELNMQNPATSMKIERAHRIGPYLPGKAWPPSDGGAFSLLSRP